MGYGQNKVDLMASNKIGKVFRAKGSIRDDSFAAIDQGGEQRENARNPVEWTEAEQHRLGSKELRAEGRLESVN